MSRRGAKIKIIKQKSKNDGTSKKDVTEMFNQMMGLSDADTEVLLPKINKIYKNIAEYNRVFNVLLYFKVFTDQFTDHKEWFDDISMFLHKLTSTSGIDMSKRYDDDQILTAEENPLHYYKMDSAALNVFYKDLKDNEYIKKMIITSNNLEHYKKYLADNDDLGSFIYREPGIKLQPFAFTTFDLKIIWGADSMTDKSKQFIMSILRHVHRIGIEMYDVITSPDIDIKKFSKILIDSITKMKKQIPRCDKAFKLIENSVSMLEKNFKTYFRGSVEAGNPNIIIESFIIDISTTQKSSPAVAREFRMIVSHLKMMNAQNNDPKIKKLFSMMNDNFASLDKELGVKPSPSEEADDDISGEFEEIKIHDSEDDYEKV